MESPSSQAVFIAVMNCSFVHCNSLRSRCAASFCSWVILNTAMIISGGICSPATSLCGRDCKGHFSVECKGQFSVQFQTRLQGSVFSAATRRRFLCVHGAAPKKEGDGLKCAVACQLVETLELVSHLRHQRVAHRFEGEPASMNQFGQHVIPSI